MAKESKQLKSWETVLCQRNPDNPRCRPDQRKIRRYFQYWREQKSIPFRCDNPSCTFHTQKLNWAGKSLNLILDHKDGNPFNNYPDNLQFLCPNCDSQLETRGGRNRGRVKHIGEGFVIRKDPSDAEIIERVIEMPDGGTITLMGSIAANSL